MRNLLFVTALAVAGCSSAAPAPEGRSNAAEAKASTTATTSPKRIRAWVGVYASPSEISGFAGSVLDLMSGADHAYRLRRYSDVRSANNIEQDELAGSYLTDADVLYLPQASGYMIDGKPRLLASMERYTRIQINGHAVLMRDDALRAFREENKFHDYGILIQVSDQANGLEDLKKVQHPSIKLLYINPIGGWADPLVHGPNNR